MRSLLWFTAGSLLLFVHAAAWSQEDPVQDRLDRAIVTYNESRDKAIKPLERSIRDKIEAAKNKGDLDTKKLFEAALQSLEEGSLPSLQALQAVTKTAERELARAKSKLLAEYRDAERDYVKQGSDERAEAVRSESSEIDVRLTQDVAMLADRAKAKPAAAKPATAKPTREIFLSDLPERDVSTADPFGKNGSLGYLLASKEQRITVRGQVAEKGISMVPFGNGRSSVTYDVPQGFATFKAVAAMNDSADPAIQVTPCTFKVLCADKVLWESPPLRGRGAVAECSVQLKGCSEVTLIVECPGLHNCAHAVWVDPRFQVK